MDLLGPIYLDNFEDAILELQEVLLYAAYFILVSGMIVRLARVTESAGDFVSMIKPVFTGFLIVAIISTLPFWFDRLSQGFSGLATYINEDFGSEPFAVSNQLMDTINENPDAEGWGIEKIVNSIYLSVVYGLAKIAVIVAALFQVPFFILQYVLKWLGFLFLPIGLSLMIFPSLGNIGVKLISNLLAVLAWPIGFAITNLAAMGFINDFATAATFTGNTTGATLYMMSFGSLVMGLIAGLILIIGTLATPTVMFILFASGAGLQGLTGVATGAAVFTTYMSRGMASGGKSKGGKSSSSKQSRGNNGPGPTSGYDGIGPSGGSPVNEPSVPYNSTSSEIVPTHSMYSPAQTRQANALPGNKPKALPQSPKPVNPLLPHSPNDPSGDRYAARIYALGSSTQSVINI